MLFCIHFSRKCYLSIYLSVHWFRIHHSYNLNFLWNLVAGNSGGITIHAVFVTKASGEKLKRYAGLTNIEVWLIPSFENSAWSIMAISFISLLAMSAVLATCFFVRRHRIRRERPHSSLVREFHGMSSRLVKAMPSLIFTAVLEDNCTSMTCAICLEDYCVGEKLRILPCCHSKPFHLTSFSASLFSKLFQLVGLEWLGKTFMWSECVLMEFAYILVGRALNLISLAACLWYSAMNIFLWQIISCYFS